MPCAASRGSAAEDADEVPLDGYIGVVEAETAVSDSLDWRSPRSTVISRCERVDISDLWRAIPRLVRNDPPHAVLTDDARTTVVLGRRDLRRCGAPSLSVIA